VGGPACENKITQGLLKEIGSAEPWIFDPTAEGAVDPAVGAVHKPMVDRSLNAKGYATYIVHRRSNGPDRLQARAAVASPGTGAVRRCLTGDSPAHPILLLRAPFRARVGSTRSWGACEQA
jgi:hypothetical protein